MIDTPTAKINVDNSFYSLQILSRYGSIRECRLVRDIVTGMSKMYAFVEFERSRQAERCYDQANGLVIDEHKILVDWEFGRTLKNWVPRRMGQSVDEFSFI